MSKNKKQLIYFSTIETKLLQDILSTIIPGEGSFPSADKVNVLEYSESVLEIDPILRRVYCEGIKNIDCQSIKDQQNLESIIIYRSNN